MLAINSFSEAVTEKEAVRGRNCMQQPHSDEMFGNKLKPTPVNSPVTTNNYHILYHIHDKINL